MINEKIALRGITKKTGTLSDETPLKLGWSFNGDHLVNLKLMTLMSYDSGLVTIDKEIYQILIHFSHY